VAHGSPSRLARRLQATLAMTIPVTVFRRFSPVLGTAAACLLVLNAQAQEPARATEPLSAIRAAAQSFAKSQVPTGPGAGETAVTAGQLDSRLHLTACQGPLTAGLPAGMTLQARSTVGVTCAGPVHWTVYVPVVMESRINVLVLKHAVARDVKLTAADVAVETRKVAGPGTAYLNSAGELGGRIVRRPLAAGVTLSADMFSADLIVHRGQEVTLLSQGGAIEVRAGGKAMADAAAGARVQVQNMSSMRIVEGVVESADVVRVAR
jgi:flagellar basal body P-ring formation protein FlgA